jgi:hypothetical protein
VSCASAGTCGAGGLYTAAGGKSPPFVVSEKGGTWGTAEEVPGMATLNQGAADLNSVSCASAGNCSAGGFYQVGQTNQAFAVSETNGTWGTAKEVPGTAALNVGGSASVTSVSCTSAGTCGAAGFYLNKNGNAQPFVVSEANGTWGTAQSVAIGSATSGDAQALTVSCRAAGNCSAGGFYTHSSKKVQAFVVDETSGRWGTALEVPGTAALNGGGNAVVNSVSCASAGNCGAAGSYTQTSTNQQAFVVVEKNGTWGTAQEVAGTLNAGGQAQANSVSCASAGNCSAGGSYTGKSGNIQAFVVGEVNGSWGTAEEVPGIAGLNAGGLAEFNSVSCASAGNCGAGGDYTDGPGNFQAFVVSETNGTWGTAEEVPGTAGLNAGGDASVTSVSCASAGKCSAGGDYTDGSGKFQAFVANET